MPARSVWPFPPTLLTYTPFRPRPDITDIPDAPF